jgi:Lipid A 3-O-deacylase (PagL)
MLTLRSRRERVRDTVVGLPRRAHSWAAPRSGQMPSKPEKQSPIARWHLLTEPSASLFFESGVGLVYFGSAFPPSGTNLNFTPMYGLGSLIRVRDGVDLRLGVRHQHFSNAGVLGGGNPGFDSNGVSIGFQFRLDGAPGGR